MNTAGLNKKTANETDVLEFGVRSTECSSIADVRSEIDEFERIERNIIDVAYVVDNCEGMPAIISNTCD